MTVRSSPDKWTVRNFLVVVLMVMVTNIVEGTAEKVNRSGQREKEIELKLKQLNKQPLKSMESSNGEIIDCISITKQIAFDHPLLKNHTIQMKPSSYPHKVSNEDDASDQSDDIAQLWQLSEDCPENTIPVKRVTKEDLSRIENYGKKISDMNISQSHQLYHPNTMLTVDNGHEYAMRFTNGIFGGAKAKISVWKPKIQEFVELSGSQISVIGSTSLSNLHSLEAGWLVKPVLFRDANPRFYISWTRDGYQTTGCYNLYCPGFVQTNKRIVLGAMIEPTSIYNGEQFAITVLIWKDPKSGNWWLQFNDKEVLGYWPGEILPNLRNGANLVQWGGEATNLKNRGQHTTTQMGSGHFPSEGFKKASYFKNMKIVDMTNGFRDPDGLQTFVSRRPCYNLRTGYDKNWEVFFYYGGPGRNPRCPLTMSVVN